MKQIALLCLALVKLASSRPDGETIYNNNPRKPGVKSQYWGQGVQPTYVPKFDMKFPGGGNAGAAGAAGPAGPAAAPSSSAQWAGLDECVALMKSLGKSKAHVANPGKETKMVTCAKVQYGEILHRAKFEAVFYMTVQGGKDFDLPEYGKVGKYENNFKLLKSS